MINSEPPRFGRVTRCPRSLLGAASGLCLLLWVLSGNASVPTSNELGIDMKVLKSGSPATIELRLVPKRNFDAVIIEAASGVASLNTSCDLAHTGVVAGRSYVCRAEITGKPSEAAMTLNVIARRAIPGGAVPVMEVHNLSIKNTAFAVSQKHASASHHDVAAASAVSK